MKRDQCIVWLFVMQLSVCWTLEPTSICDSGCKCSKDDNVIVVECICHTNASALILGNLENTLPPNVRHLRVDQCNNVTIESGTLGPARALKTVSVSNAKQLRIKTSSFTTEADLEFVQFKNIKELIMESGAFKNISSLLRLEIYNVSWNHISSKCFAGARTIRNLTLVYVNVEIVEMNAFHHFDHDFLSYDMTFRCCNFRNIERDGFYIPAKNMHNFQMVNSDFATVAPEAFDIAAYYIFLSGNHFNGRLESSPFKFKFSCGVFERNTFRTLGAGAFEGLEIQTLPFNNITSHFNLTQNYFHMANFSSMSLHPVGMGRVDELVVRDNRFSCLCRNSKWLLEVRLSDDYRAQDSELDINQRFRNQLHNSSACISNPNTRVAKLAQIELDKNGECIKPSRFMPDVAVPTEGSRCANRSRNKETTKKPSSSVSATRPELSWLLVFLLINLTMISRS